LRNDTIPQTVFFPNLFNTPLVATFDQPHASSDDGEILLKAAEARDGLIDGFARCLVDDRQPGKVRHTLEDLLAQRLDGLACGHPDGNSVIDRHRQRLHGEGRRITIDLDPTEDPTHGAQQLALFSSHYDSWCYLPLLAFLTFNDEVEQSLCAAILRPENAPASRGAIGTLSRLLAVLRIAFPRARFLVRLDGGFAAPEIFEFLDAEPGLDYVVAMGEHAVFK
jgi:hypothetical protein